MAVIDLRFGVKKGVSPLPPARECRTAFLAAIQVKPPEIGICRSPSIGVFIEA